MNAKQRIYYFLIDRNIEISTQYHQYRRKKYGIARIKAWLYLFGLYLRYYTKWPNKKSLSNAIRFNKDMILKRNESLPSKRESPIAFAQKLLAYDVISFDVFDTLIFRPFSTPTDMFHFTGSKLKYFDFKKLRIEMEMQARRNANEAKNIQEISLKDIWNTIEEDVGINAEVGMLAEWNDELQFCFANPYMLAVIKELRKQGKKIIIISDMYLGKSHIQKLLNMCGYGEMDGYFVSSDHKHSKSEGTLYDIVKRKLYLEKTFVHIGDNLYADKKQAEKHGFTGFHYENINAVGMKYRMEDMSVIFRSVYDGLINSYMHNGLSVYSKDYEFGFIYVGVLVLGYCQWIHECVKQEKLNKILFLTYGGEILSKVYEILYPQESEDWECVYWSHHLATKLSANHFKYNYFQHFIYQKTNQNYTLYSVFKTMEIETMLETFLQSKLCKGSYSASSILDKILADKIKIYLLQHWENVQAHYATELETRKAYYNKFLNEYKRIGVVDGSWSGTNTIMFEHVMNQVLEIDCNITGLIAGINNMHSTNQATNEALLYAGQMKCYAFIQDSIEYDFATIEEHLQVKEVQHGILEFVKYYLKHMKQISSISGNDAFAPIKSLFKHK